MTDNFTNPVRGQTEIFVALTGQRDNIGDSLLRRGLLQALPVDNPRHVLVGRNSEDYSTGLGLTQSDRTYVDRTQWVSSLVRTALRRRVSLVMNAGEITPDRPFIQARLVIVPVTWLVKLRGGSVIQAGLGVRDPSVQASRLVRRLLSCADLIAWRDEATRAWALGGTVMPDWGLSLGSAVPTLRERHSAVNTRRLVLSVRGDRPELPQEVIQGLHEAVAATGAELLVVTQVRRDAERSAWLARELGGELMPWPLERTHREHEELLREEYKLATWVISDRLHVLLAAMTEGAVPLNAVPDTSRKITRTLTGIDLIPAIPSQAEDQLDRSRQDLYQALDSARSRILSIAEEVRDRVSGEPVARKLRVLHSMSAPDSTTRYATHMAATEDLDVLPSFFTWPRALFGSYDLFHLHWPEHLVPLGGSPSARVRRQLGRLLAKRLARKKIPVVRTLHNLTPHDSERVPDETASFHQRINDLTNLDVHLVDGDPERDGVTTVHIPHGGYREPYSVHIVPAPTPGRVLFFGMLKPYKGVPELIAAFSGTSGGSLRIVGAPADDAIVALVKEASAADHRVTAKFGFIADDELAKEIGSAELVALPYHELHSSGVVLVALSTGRPVLVPRTPTTEALVQEVGPEWVRVFDGSLELADVQAAQVWASRARTLQPPNFDGRNWAAVREQHGAAYASISTYRQSATEK